MANKAMVSNGGFVVKGGGLGLGSLASLVTLAFVIAKLAGAINWSWWIVFAPILAYLALGAAVTIIVLLLIGVGLLVGFSKLKNLLKNMKSEERTWTE